MMEKIEIGDWCTLYHADSVEIIDTLKAHKPDAVIMDPPYAVPTVVASGREITRSVGDLSIVEHAMRLVLGAAADALADHGRMFVFCDQNSYPSVYRALYDRFNLALLVWDKGQIGMGREFRKSHELIVHAWRSSTPVYADGVGRADVLRCPPVPKADRVHPAQKPVDLIRQLLPMCGNTVLDTFMGGGSTGVACWQEGRKFVGCEIDRRWFDIAADRINRQTADGPLFEARPEPEQQSALI